MSLEQELNEYKLDLLENTKYFTIEELANLYENGQLDVHYNADKTEHWTNKKQDKLIKNILLGFPIPTIFLQKKDGEYLVVDGYNRLFTILRFLNVIVAWNAHLYEFPYKVEMYHPKLPSFKETTWDNGGKRLSKKLKEKFLNYRIPVYFVKN